MFWQQLAKYYLIDTHRPHQTRHWTLSQRVNTWNTDQEYEISLSLFLITTKANWFLFSISPYFRLEQTWRDHQWTFRNSIMTTLYFQSFVLVFNAITSGDREELSLCRFKILFYFQSIWRQESWSLTEPDPLKPEVSLTRASQLNCANKTISNLNSSLWCPPLISCYYL